MLSTSLVALAAVFIAVAAAAALTGASPLADSMDADGVVAEDGEAVQSELSTGRLGALAESHASEVDGENVDGVEDAAEAADVDEDVVDAVEEALDDVDDDAVEEAMEERQEEGAGEADDVVEDTVEEIQEDIEDDVDNETLEMLVEAALDDVASEEEDEAAEETEDETEPSEDHRRDGDVAAEADAERDDTTADVSDAAEGEVDAEDVEDDAGDEEDGAAVPSEAPIPVEDVPGGDRVLAALAVVAFSVAAFLAYRRDALTLDAVKNLPRTVAEAVVEAAFGVAEFVGEAVSRIRDASSVFAGARSVLALAVHRLRRLASSGDPSPGEMAAEVADDARQMEGDEASARRTILESWSVITRASGLDSPDRRTPGEVSRAAVSRGLPRAPVQQVTEAFREVEYGGGDPDVGVEKVRTAMLEIKDSVEGG